MSAGRRGEQSEFDLLFEWGMYLLLAVLAVSAVLGAILVGPAEVGARLLHGRWLPVAGEDLVTIGWYWLHHLRDPMGGWPRVSRAQLPGMALYLLLLAVELVGVGLMTYVGIRAWRGWRGGAQRGRQRRLERQMGRRHHV